MKYYVIFENNAPAVYDNTGKLMWDGKSQPADPEVLQISLHFASNFSPNHTVQMRFLVIVVSDQEHLKSLISKHKNQ